MHFGTPIYVYMLLAWNNLKSAQVITRERIITIINDHLLKLAEIISKSPEVQRNKSCAGKKKTSIENF